ncbi:MAG TPA: hypothetical protein PLG05_02780 [Bacteroidales bacterium]|nr:hypothetical protein [Bacteroidales bacterium]HOR59641.1 hypothetical protein [Bacteroidales bacterium]HPL04081.1 hypothetical protein [Bacteroidales bacterium]
MKNFNILSILIASILLFSCQKQEKSIVLNKEKSVLVDLREEPMSIVTPYSVQVVNFDNKEVLVAYFFDSNFLYFFDMNNGEILEKTPLGYRRVEGFHVASNDSIFVLYSNQFNDGYIDSTNFVRMNSKGNILDYYAFEHPQIASKDKTLLQKDFAFYPICRSVNLPKSGDLVVLDLTKWYPEDIGTSEFMKTKTPVLAVFDLHDKTFRVCEEYWYPGIKEGVYYPGQDHAYSTCISKSGNPLSRFFFSGTLTEWDVQNNKLITHEFKSQLVDSIYPISKPATHYTNELDAQYRTINYDPYRDLYFSVLWFNPNIYGYGAYSLVVSDGSFKYLGEIFYPGIGTWSPLFTKDYIIGFNDDVDGFLSIDFYKIDKGDMQQSDYIKSIKDSLAIRKSEIAKKATLPVAYSSIDANETLYDCLKGFTDVSEEKLVLVTVYLAEGCPSCVNYVLRALEDNKELLNEYPIYFLLTARDRASFKSFVSEYDFSDCKHLILDETGLLYLSTNIEPSNPRIQFVENDKIIQDTVYLPKDLYDLMIPEIFKFFEVEATTKVK